MARASVDGHTIPMPLSCRSRAADISWSKREVHRTGTSHRVTQVPMIQYQVESAAALYGTGSARWSRLYESSKLQQSMASSIGEKALENWVVADQVDASPLHEAGEKPNQARSLQPTRTPSSICCQCTFSCITGLAIHAFSLQAHLCEASSGIFVVCAPSLGGVLQIGWRRTLLPARVHTLFPSSPWKANVNLGCWAWLGRGCD